MPGMAVLLLSSHLETRAGVPQLRLPHLGAGDSQRCSLALVSISSDVYKEFKPLPLEESPLMYARSLLRGRFSLLKPNDGFPQP